MKEHEVQVKLGDDVATIAAEPHTLFRIIRALKEDGHDPHVRYHDDELRDWTCWQPTHSKAA